jgi:hypothetical protein
MRKDGWMTDGPRENSDADPETERPRRSQQVVVVGPDGRPVGSVTLDSDTERSDEESDPTRLVEQPAKVMRIGSMIKQLLEEVRAAPLDEAGRNRLKQIHSRSIEELEEGLAPELRDELERLSLPFTEDVTPTEPELRIAQAQLVGWLEGLFHGMQAALVAQQMAARAQLEHMRRGVPALEAGPRADLGRLDNQHDHGHGTGQYL